MQNKILKYLSIIVTTLLLLLLVAPMFIPLDMYTEKAVEAVRKSTGRDLSIGGARVSLLPTPSVTLSEVKLSSVPGARTPNMIEVQNVTATLSLGELLTGNIVISYIDIASPVVTLEKLTNGRANWEFSSSEIAAKSNDQQVQTTKVEPSQSLPFLIREIIISGGTIHYITPDGHNTAENLDTKISMSSLTGPMDLSLTFKALENPLTVKAHFDSLKLDEVIPLTISAEINDSNIQLVGELNPVMPNVSFAGKLTVTGEIDKLDEVAGTKEVEARYSATSDLMVNTSKAEIDDIKVSVGALSATGSANYTFAANAGNLGMVFMPGNFRLNVAPNNQSGTLTSKIDAKIDQLKDFLSAAGVDVKSLPISLANTLSFNANAVYKDQDLTLKNIAFQTGDAALQGMFKVHDFSAPVISYDLSTNNMGAIMALLGNRSGMQLRDVSIKGETTVNNGSIKTNTVLSVAKTSIAAGGSCDMKDGDISLEIAAASKNFGQTLGQLSKSTATFNLGELNMLTRLNGNLHKQVTFHVAKSNLVMAGSNNDFSGEGKVLFDNKPKLTLDMRCSIIDLNAFGSSSESNSPTNRNQKTLSNSSGAPWSHDKIDLSALDNFKADVNITIDRLKQGELVFDNINAKIKVDDGTFDLLSLSGNLYGGKVNLSARVPSNPKSSVVIDGGIKGAQLKNVTPEAGKIKITQGAITAQADLKTKGTSQAEYVDNLAGTINLKGTEGKLSGMSLNKIVDALSNIQNLDGVLKGLNTAFEGGETTFKNLNADIVVEKGVANLNNAKMDINNAEATARGIIDLPKYVLDVKANIHTDIKSMPPFGARLYGSLNNVQHALDLDALKKHIVQNVLGGVIDSIKSGKTRPEDILNSVLGKGKNQAPPAQQSSDQPAAPNNEPAEQQQDSQTPQKAVNKLLNKGLKELFK